MAELGSDIIEQRRRMLEWTEQDLEILGPCPAHLSQDTIEVPLPDGTTYRTIIVRPTSATNDTKKCPLVILFHGGGWSVGDPEFMLGPARGYASVFGAVVVSPSYKYAPENRFPAPMQSAYEITAWFSHPENLNDGALKDTNVRVDLAKGFIIGGVSAGGNLAAVIAGIAAAAAADDTSKLAEGLDAIAQPITGTFLAVPVLVHRTIVPARYAPMWTSRGENADAPHLPAAAMEAAEEQLGADPRSPWYSPLNLELAGIAGHHAPRVYLQAGQFDVLRDDAPVYAKALEDNGVAETRVDIIENIDHAGWCSVPHPYVHTEEMRTKALDGMAWLLNTQWDKSGELPY